MSVHTSQARLIDAMKQLTIKWAHIRQRWDDPASRQIQKDYIDPLGPIVRSTVLALNQVNELMAAARRDCEDDRS